MEFEWDVENEAHSFRHGLTPATVGQVAGGQPEFFINEKGQTGTHIMLGPAEDGTLWTIILLDVGDDRWRPITGWPSAPAEIEKYRHERAKNG